MRGLILIVLVILLLSNSFATTIDNLYATCLSEGYSWVDTSSGLIGYWRFNEGAGTTAYDTMGTSNGAMQNMESTDWVMGIQGRALQFDGTNEYVQIPHSASFPFSGTNTWSIAMWVNYETGVTYYPQFNKGTTTTGITIHGQNGRIEGGDGTNTFDYNNPGMFGTSLVGLGWKHTVITYDGATFKGYVNGVNTGTYNWANGIGTSANQINIGNFWGGYYKGKIDDVRIYNRVLSPTEVKFIYNSTQKALYSSCCGDDRLLDNFYSSSGICYQGKTSTNADLNKEYAQLNNYAWFTLKPQFASPSIMETGSYINNPVKIAAGNVNNNDLNDLIVIKSSSNSNERGYKLLSPDSKSWFSASYLTSYIPQDVVLGDVNGDGYLDVIILYGGSSYMSVSLNDGSSLGGFGSPTYYAVTGSQPRGISAGDLDNDGDLDIVVATWFGNNFNLFRNTGSGAFEAPVTYSTTGYTHDIAVGDIDGDGDLDVLTANGDTFYFSLFRNTGSGTFEAAVNYQASGSYAPYTIALGDLDNDGDLDVATLDADSSPRFSFFKNDGTGTLSWYADYTTGSQPIDIAINDMDGDGDLDVMTADYVSNRFSFFENTGSDFKTAVSYTTGKISPNGVIATDIDGDSDPDVVTADFGTSGGYGGLSIFKNMGINTTLSLEYYTPPACGDDGASDEFYNTSHACYNGQVTTNHDSFKAFCNDKSYNWFTGTVSGTNSPCCGDDKSLDMFYNSTHYCYFGEITTAPDFDLSKDFCEDSGYSWLSASPTFSSTSLFATMPHGAEYPWFILIDDLNSDGNDDILARVEWSGNLYAWYGSGNGVFSSRNTIGTAVSILNSGDIDGDGDTDLVGTDAYSKVYKFTNNGGTFTTTLIGDLGIQTKKIKLFDADNDNDLDFIVEGGLGGGLHLYLNNGLGGFTYKSTLTTSIDSVHKFVMNDIDDNGFDDIVFSIYGADLYVLYNYGDYAFSALTQIDNTDNFGADFVLIDFEHDGDLDIVYVAQAWSQNDAISYVYLKRNNGQGIFSSRETLASKNSFLWYLRNEDLNFDGYDDFLMSGTTQAYTGVIDGFFRLMSNADGTYGTLDLVSSTPQREPVLSDVNNDGNFEIFFSGDISIYNLTISTISGTNFPCCGDDDASDNFYNSTKACYNGQATTNGDSFKDFCNSKGYQWFTGTVSGTNSPCCGDDKSLDMFYNSTHYCYFGEITTTPNFDLSKDFCEQADYNWFSNEVNEYNRVTYYTGNYAYFFSVEDVNNDNYPDIISSRRYDGLIGVRINNGDGTLATEVTYSVGSTFSVFTSDLNNDYYPDIISVPLDGSSITVLMNDLDGTFTLSNTYSISGSAYNLDFGDFNGDNYLDIAISVYSSSLLNVLMNNGDGTFGNLASYTAGTNPFGVSVGDLDSDGNIDIVNTNEASNLLNVYINDGDGAFNAAVTYAAGTAPRDVLIADLNKDGAPDVVVAEYGPAGFGSVGGIIIFMNNGDGTLASGVYISQLSRYSEVDVKDIDGDGDLDIVASDYNYQQVDLYKNNGDGTFASRIAYSVGLAPTDLSIVDFDNDGDQDILSCDYNSRQFSFINMNGIKGNKGPCCGDDASEYFFNSTKESTEHFCHNSVYYNAGIDYNSNACTYYGHSWLNNPFVNTFTGSYSWSYNSADIDDDDNKDFIACLENGDLYTGLGMGNGSFTQTQTVSSGVSGGTCFSITTNDFDRDGDTDAVAVLKHTTNGPTIVYYKNTAGTFNAHSTLVVGTGTSTPYITSGEITGDAYPDLVISSVRGSVFSVFTNNAGNGFTFNANYGTGGNEIKLVNIDSDADLDAVYADGSNTIIYLNNNNASFLAGNSYPGGVHFSIGDLNNDGNLDLVTMGPSTIHSYLGNGAGTFSLKESFTSSYATWATGLGDVNADSKIDLITTDSSQQYFNFLEGNGDGTFKKGGKATVLGTYGLNAVIDDFTNDGLSDVLTGGYIKLFKSPNKFINASCCGDDNYEAFTDGVSQHCYNKLLLGEPDTNQNYCEQVFTYFSTVTSGTNFPCCGDDLTLDVFYNTSLYCYQGRPTTDGDLLENLCLLQGNKWFNGGVTGLSGPCCGDDNNENFYNGTLGNTTHFCQDSVFINNEIDLNKTICEYYDNDWLNLNVSHVRSQTLTAGGYTHTIILSDINNDGNQDLLAIEANAIVSWLGNSDGTFGTRNAEVPIDYSNGGIIKASDLNNDNNADIILLNTFTNYVLYWLGNGDGTFGAMNTLYIPSNSLANFDIGDLNEDDNIDIIAVSGSADFVYYWLGNGDGTFGTLNSAASYEGYHVLLTDTNNDHHTDVVHSLVFDGLVTLLGDGTGALTYTSTTTYEGQAHDIAAADVNNDGNIDIIDTVQNYLRLFTGNGDGTFDSPSIISIKPAGGSLGKIIMRDLNKDGELDIVVSTSGFSIGYDNGISLYYWLGNGDGTFSSARLLASADTWINDFVSGDFDKNGLDDFIIDNWESNNMLVFLNSQGNYPSCCGDDYGTLTSLIGEWHLDENTGSIASDSAFDNDGTLVNSPIWTSGKYGSALNFDGSTNYVSIPHNGALSFNPTVDSYTISLWFNADTLNSDPSTYIDPLIIDRSSDSDGPKSYLIDVRIEGGVNKISYHMWDGSSQPTYLNYNGITTNRWYHVVAVADTTNIKLYVDGALIDSEPIIINSFEITDNIVELGRVHPWYGIDYFDGTIDEVRIYNQALSDADILQIYESSPYTHESNADIFYNGSIGSTNSFCHGGTLITDYMDNNEELCNYYYPGGWFTSVLSSTENAYCCGDDLNNDLFYNANYACYQGTVTTEADTWQEYCKSNPIREWLTGDITGSNSPCCGDDSVNDLFDNSTSGIGGFCINGDYIFGSADDDEQICDYLASDWFSDSQETGNNCCGDDGSLDDFGNRTGNCCCNGIVTPDGEFCDLDNDGNTDSQCVNGNLPNIFISYSTYTDSFVTSTYSPEFLLKNTGDGAITVLSTVFTNTTINCLVDPSNPKEIEKGNTGTFKFNCGSFNCADMDKEFYPTLNITFRKPDGTIESIIRNLNFRVRSPLDIISVTPQITDSLPAPINEAKSLLLTLKNQGTEPIDFKNNIDYSEGLFLLFNVLGNNYDVPDLTRTSFTIQPSSSMIYRINVVPLTVGDKNVQINFNNLGTCTNISDAYSFKITGFTTGSTTFSVSQVSNWDWAVALALTIIPSLILYRKLKKEE